MLNNKKISKNAAKDGQAHKSLVDWNDLRSDMGHKICEMFVSLWFPYPPMSSYQHLSYTLGMWTSESSPKLKPGSSSSWAMWPQHFSMETQQIEDVYMILFSTCFFREDGEQTQVCLSKIPWRSLNHLPQKSQLDLSSECLDVLKRPSGAHLLGLVKWMIRWSLSTLQSCAYHPTQQPSPWS